MTDDLMDRFPDNDDSEKNTGNTDDQGNSSSAGTTDGKGNRQNVKNYPCYLPGDLREELDGLYNQYDGKNKVEGGDGIEKHREFLEPLLRAAVDELDLDDVVPYEVTDAE